MAITIVYGDPGVGKGVYMTATALGYMDDSQQALDCLYSSQGQVDRLYNQGFSAYMQLDTVVYADYAITNQLGIARQLNSYFIDGFHLGFANNDVQVSYVPPNCKIFLNEAQKYYNSRMSRYLPDWVSRYYEQHRHYGLDIWLDCQRPGLIDINIRDIVSSFIHIRKTDFIYDKIGNIIRSVSYYTEYSCWLDAESRSNGAEKTFVYNGNVFDSYDSFSNFDNFLPRTGENYIQLKEPQLDNKQDDVELSVAMYTQLAPAGFYKKR